MDVQKIYLMRNAESTKFTDKKIPQNILANLSGRGVTQAKSLGDYLDVTKADFEICFTSTYTRSIETAEYVLRNMKNLKRRGILYCPLTEEERLSLLCENVDFDAPKSAIRHIDGWNYDERGKSVAIISNKQVVNGILTNLLNQKDLSDLIRSRKTTPDEILTHAGLVVLEYGLNGWKEMKSSDPTFIDGIREQYGQR